MAEAEEPHYNQVHSEVDFDVCFHRQHLGSSAYKHIDSALKIRKGELARVTGENFLSFGSKDQSGMKHDRGVNKEVYSTHHGSHAHETYALSVRIKHGSLEVGLVELDLAAAADHAYYKTSESEDVGVEPEREADQKG